MTDYEPGTVAVATVDGEPGVRVMSTTDKAWVSGTFVKGYRLHLPRQVTDVRPLVVLDLPNADRTVKSLKAARNIIPIIRQDLKSPLLTLTAQIEAQTRPKPAEPTGLGAVVRDREGFRWVSAHNGRWFIEDEFRHFADIDVVEVLSPGVTP